MKSALCAMLTTSSLPSNASALPGGSSTTKAGLLAEPPVPVVTVVVPVAVAPTGTRKVTLVAVLPRMVAAAPFTVRAVVPARLVPVRVTGTFTPAGLGLKLPMVGGGTRFSNTLALVAPPKPLAVTKSRSPSPSTSPAATQVALPPVA